MALFLAYMASPAFVYLVMSLANKKSILSDEQSRKHFSIICGIIMFLMMGLRSRYIGSGDTNLYCEIWENLSVSSGEEFASVLKTIDMEKGFLLTIWILSHIFPNAQMMLVLSAAFFSLSVCRFIFLNAKNPLLALFAFNCLGLFSFMIQGMRQAIAMCICLWAIEQCKNKRFIGFALLIVLACTFHASAVVFAVVWFISRLKVNGIGLVVFGGCTVVAFLLLPRLFEIMNSLMNDDYGLGAQSDQGGWVAIMIYIAIIVFAFLWRNASIPNYNLFMYLTLVGFVTFVLRNTVSGIAERISYYFSFGQMILLSNSIGCFTDKDTKLLFNILAAGLCFGVAVHKASYSSLVPYTLFWQL